MSEITVNEVTIHDQVMVRVAMESWGFDIIPPKGYMLYLTGGNVEDYLTRVDADGACDENGRIYLREDFLRKTLWHEMCHAYQGPHLEEPPQKWEDPIGYLFHQKEAQARCIEHFDYWLVETGGGDFSEVAKRYAELFGGATNCGVLLGFLAHSMFHKVGDEKSPKVRKLMLVEALVYFCKSTPRLRGSVKVLS